MSFVRDDQIQAGIIAYLKSRSLVTVEVTDEDGVVEIREDQWQGDAFDYPNVRVRLISNTPIGPPCYHAFECGLMVFAQDASSLNADRISGIIANELHEKGFTSNSLAFSTVVTNVIPAVRDDIRTWRSEVLIRGMVAG